VNAIMKASDHFTFSSFSRYAYLKSGDVQVLVGRGSRSRYQWLPIRNFSEYRWKNADRMRMEYLFLRILQAKIQQNLLNIRAQDEKMHLCNLIITIKLQWRIDPAEKKMYIFPRLLMHH
jgi:hypothetical protein